MLITPHVHSPPIPPSHRGTRRQKGSAHARVGYGKRQLMLVKPDEGAVRGHPGWQMAQGWSLGVGSDKTGTAAAEL